MKFSQNEKKKKKEMSFGETLEQYLSTKPKLKIPTTDLL